VQLLKWRDRWRHYLRSVTSVCISFEITLVHPATLSCCTLAYMLGFLVLFFDFNSVVQQITVIVASED